MSDNKRVNFFGKINYILMIIGVLFIAVGFMLMAGGGNELGPDGYAWEFDAEGLYSFRRITLAPILILIGFIIEVASILFVKPDAK